MNPSIPAALLLFSTAALASPTGDGAAHNPQIGKLGYYVGTWEGHGQTKGGPFGAAGKLSSKQTCSWFAGGFQVVCRGEEHGPSGNRQFLNILAYDENAKTYTEYSVSSFGEAEYDQGGSFAGGKLTFHLSQNVAGKPVRFRYTENHLSPVLYTYRAEVAMNGKPWTELAEGEIRKTK